MERRFHDQVQAPHSPRGVRMSDEVFTGAADGELVLLSPVYPGVGTMTQVTFQLLDDVIGDPQLVLGWNIRGSFRPYGPIIFNGLAEGSIGTWEVENPLSRDLTLDRVQVMCHGVENVPIGVTYEVVPSTGVPQSNANRPVVPPREVRNG